MIVHLDLYIVALIWIWIPWRAGSCCRERSRTPLAMCLLSSTLPEMGPDAAVSPHPVFYIGFWFLFGSSTFLMLKIHGPPTYLIVFLYFCSSTFLMLIDLESQALSTVCDLELAPTDEWADSKERRMNGLHSFFLWLVNSVVFFLLLLSCSW